MMVQLFARQGKEREQRDELLSAYLDDQLSAEERARLEAQLATDPALRAELDALRQTVALVHALPPVPLPHNFILPAQPRPAPSMHPRRAWVAPLMTAATALAALLFVVVLAGDLLPFGAGGLARAPAVETLLEAEAPQAAVATPPASEEAEAEMRVEKTVLTEPAVEAPMEAPAELAESEEANGNQEHAGEADVVATVLVEAAPAPVTPTTADGGPAEGPATPALTPTPSPGVVEREAKAPATPAPATVTPAEVSDWGEPTPPREVGQAAAPTVEEGVSEAVEDEAGARWSISTRRGGEIILGLVTLGLALATVWAWRTRRR
jgi:hypothetical protein